MHVEQVPISHAASMPMAAVVVVGAIVVCVPVVVVVCSVVGSKVI